jgi:nucleotide-binding universal stress UspA family protein
MERKRKEMIPQIKKILYATDLSKNSSFAFLYAIDMAKRHNAKIVCWLTQREEIKKAAQLSASFPGPTAMVPAGLLY